MAKLEGKLPFNNAMYAFRDTGEIIKVISRERTREGVTWIHYINKRNQQLKCNSADWYTTFKRCKEGTPFHTEEGWNE